MGIRRAEVELERPRAELAGVAGRRAADRTQVCSKGVTMSDSGGADGPREPSMAECPIFHAGVERVRSAGIGVRTMGPRGSIPDGRLKRWWEREACRFSRTEEHDTYSGKMEKGQKEFISPQSHKLFIRSSRYSLSVAGGWPGLASIP